MRVPGSLLQWGEQELLSSLDWSRHTCAPLRMGTGYGLLGASASVCVKWDRTTLLVFSLHASIPFLMELFPVTPKINWQGGLLKELVFLSGQP